MARAAIQIGRCCLVIFSKPTESSSTTLLFHIWPSGIQQLWRKYLNQRSGLCRTPSDVKSENNSVPWVESLLGVRIALVPGNIRKNVRPRSERSRIGCSAGLPKVGSINV